MATQELYLSEIKDLAALLTLSEEEEEEDLYVDVNFDEPVDELTFCF